MNRSMNAAFKLDLLVNVPGPSALAIRVGLAPGNIRWLAMAKANLKNKFPEYCASKRHLERVSLEMI